MTYNLSQALKRLVTLCTSGLARTKFTLWIFFLIFLLWSSRAHFSSHKLCFMNVFLCPKANLRTPAFPALLLIRVCFCIPAVLLVFFCNLFPSRPVCPSQPVRHRHRQQHALMALWWDAWPWRHADIEEEPWDGHSAGCQSLWWVPVFNLWTHKRINNAKRAPH